MVCSVQYVDVDIKVWLCSVHLAGHVSVAGDVAVAVVADVAVDSLVQRPEGRDVRIRLLVNHSHLEDLIR